MDDDPDITKQILDDAESGKLIPGKGSSDVERCHTFNEAYKKLETTRLDFVILDLKDNEQAEHMDDASAGLEVFNQIKRRRFLPVVFYTALAHKVRDLETSFVRVVEKTEGLKKLREEMKAIFETGLPQLIKHLDEEQRSYMWEFVNEHWSEFPSGDTRTDLTYLLARRLAAQLRGSTVRHFLIEQTGLKAVPEGESGVHPMDFYIIPPLKGQQFTGDLYKTNSADGAVYRVLLTPSCDLARKRKDALHLLFAHCHSLTDQEEFEEWQSCVRARDDDESKIKNVEQRLVSLLRNNRGNKYQPERYFFLPSAMDIPNLVVDYQKLEAVCKDEFEKRNWLRVASLDSPFAEELLTRFARYFGRIGTPDLDTNIVLSRLNQ